MASSKKNNKAMSILFGPFLVIGGIMALWENEGRFDYAKAAREATEIVSIPAVASDRSISLTSNLDTDMPIAGNYIREFVGYYRVDRQAEIYSWKTRRKDDRTVWEKGWYSRVESNSRNEGLVQTLYSATLYPPRYQLGPLQVHTGKIHLVDRVTGISVETLELTGMSTDAGLQPQGNYLYKQRSPGATAQLGDERLAYQGVPNAPVATYFGRITGETGVAKQFEISTSIVSAFIANDGILHHLVNGDRPTALRTLRGHFQRLKWMVRGGGTLAIVIGINAIFSSFVNLLYRIPLLGGLISRGVFLVSLVIALPIALFIMLSSILVHHPFLVALPLGLVIAAIVFFRRQSKAVKVRVEGALHEQQVALAAENHMAADTASDAELMELTLTNLVKLASADGELDKKERKYIGDWAERNGIDGERATALIDSAEHAEGEMRATTRNDLVLLVCLAMADGALSTRELSRLLAFGKKLGMDAKAVREIIIEVETGMLAPG